jgi:hypothetical protein
MATLLTRDVQTLRAMWQYIGGHGSFEKFQALFNKYTKSFDSFVFQRQPSDVNIPNCPDDIERIANASELQKLQALAAKRRWLLVVDALRLGYFRLLRPRRS